MGGRSVGPSVGRLGGWAVGWQRHVLCVAPSRRPRWPKLGRNLGEIDPKSSMRRIPPNKAVQQIGRHRPKSVQHRSKSAQLWAMLTDSRTTCGGRRLNSAPLAQVGPNLVKFGQCRTNSAGDNRCCPKFDQAHPDLDRPRPGFGRTRASSTEATCVFGQHIPKNREALLSPRYMPAHADATSID